MRRVQVHLSTAVVMSLAAGVLLWSNFLPQVMPERHGKSAISEWVDEAHNNYGWPQIAYVRMEPDKPNAPAIFYWKDAAFDGVVAALILFAV